MAPSSSTLKLVNVSCVNRRKNNPKFFSSLFDGGRGEDGVYGIKGVALKSNRTSPFAGLTRLRVVTRKLTSSVKEFNETSVIYSAPLGFRC